MEWQVVAASHIPALGRKIQSWKAIVIDVETVGAEPYLGARHIGLGLGSFEQEQYYYLPLQNLNKFDLQPLIEPLEQKPLIGHNIKFDLHMLARLGWQGKQESFIDTIVMARLWAKEEHPQLSLKELGKQIFSFEYPNQKVVQMVKTSKADQIPLPDLAEYCCTDLWLTKRLYNWLKLNLSPELLRLFVRETQLTRDLFDMEARGVMIDIEYLEGAVKLLDAKLEDLLALIRSSSSLPDFNPGSPQQVRKLMEQLEISPVAQAKTGPSWDREALLEVRGQHEIALGLAKYRALSYQRNGFIERAFKYAYVNEGGNILHGEFKNWGTFTGRLSGDLQQIPKGWLQFGAADDQGEDVLVWELDNRAREKEFSLRRLLRPRPGHVLIKADYKQIEMFVLGFYMKDPTFDRWLNSEHGVHYAVAEELWGNGAEFKERGKVYNFATVYGQGELARAKQLHCSREESRRYREQYEERMPGYRRLLNRVRRLLERDGIIKNIYGREYQLDPEVAYRGVNYLCQGSAGDYVKFRLPKTRQLRKQIGIEMLITTHDDFVAEIPEEQVKQLPEWLESLRISPFGRKLELDTEYSRSSLVQLYPFPPAAVA